MRTLNFLAPKTKLSRKMIFVVGKAERIVRREERVVGKAKKVVSVDDRYIYGTFG